MKTILVIIVVSFVIFFLVGNHANAYGGGAIIGPSSYLSKISASKNNVYLVWSDYDPSENVYHTLFRASNDGGKSFGDIVNMGNSFTGPTFSQMSSYGDNLYIALGNTIKKSTDAGHTFEDIIPVKAGGTMGISNIVATENNVYLIMDNITNSGNGFEILLVSSADNGITFGKPVKLFGMPESSQDYSQIAASGTNVYVVAEGKYGGMQGSIGVLYRASRDGGITFSKTVDLSDNGSIDYAPKIATVGSNVYVAWSELASGKENTDLYLRTSTDGGNTFGPKTKLNQDMIVSGTYNTDFIQLLAHDMNLYVKWWDVHFLPNGTESAHLLFIRGVGGETFGKITELTIGNARPISIGVDPVISFGGNNVYTSWQEYSDFPHSQTSTFFRKSSDGGFTFDNVVNLSLQDNATSHMYNSQIVSWENNVYVAGDTASQSRELFILASNDGGNTFGKAKNLDNASVIPEFTFAIPVLLVSIMSMIIFYRMKFRK